LQAVEHIRETGAAKGLQRGHILSRVERAKELFDRGSSMSKDELLTYFFENDTVALVTKAENSRMGARHWSKLFAVPEGLFNAGSFSIYARKNKELVWIQQFITPGAA